MRASHATVVIASTTLVPAALAGTFEVELDQPVIDQWVYSFNDDPGNRFFASVFASKTPDGFVIEFDNRDGQMLVGFDTSELVPAGKGAESYDVTSATVMITVNNDLNFEYDPTSDSYASWLQEDDPDFVPDADAGRPIEIFGTGFRNGLNASNYTEDIPYSFVGPFGKFVRNAHPITWHDFGGGLMQVDPSNNVDQLFDPVPFAVGTADGLVPGDAVPDGTVISFEINVADPNVQQYLRESVDGGRTFFSVAALFQTEQQGSAGFPSFHTKENPFVLAGLASAATLSMNVVIDDSVFGDLNGDGVVDGADLGLLLGNWGADGLGDLNGDGVVDGADLGLLLGAWTG